MIAYLRSSRSIVRLNFRGMHARGESFFRHPQGRRSRVGDTANHKSVSRAADRIAGQFVPKLRSAMPWARGLEYIMQPGRLLRHCDCRDGWDQLGCSSS